MELVSSLWYQVLLNMWRFDLCYRHLISVATPSVQYLHVLNFVVPSWQNIEKISKAKLEEIAIKVEEYEGTNP